MLYIDGLGYVDEHTYSAGSQQASASTESFETILEKETTIYATPASGTVQPNSATNTVSSPEALQQYFEDASNQYQVDLQLLLAVAKQESNFNPNATSKAGAMGIMQLMPGTANSLGVTNPYDARENIMGGAKYLSSLLAQYNGNTTLALAAYNAGSGNVKKYGGVPPFSETENYIQKVLGYMGQTITLADIRLASATTGTSVFTADNISDATIIRSTAANTIYAVASQDATSPAQVFMIPAADEPMETQ